MSPQEFLDVSAKFGKPQINTALTSAEIAVVPFGRGRKANWMKKNKLRLNTVKNDTDAIKENFVDMCCVIQWPFAGNILVNFSFRA